MVSFSFFLRPNTTFSPCSPAAESRFKNAGFPSVEIPVPYAYDDEAP